MPMVTPTLNLPQPATSAAPKTAAVAPSPAPVAPTPWQARMPDAPSTTVTLSPQALSALAASGGSSPPATAPHDSSVYESLKNGISTAAHDVGDAISDGAHALVEGVETTLSTANKVATGVLELPFALVAKGCDAVGGLIDEL